MGVIWEKQASSALQKFQIEINNHSLDLNNYDFAQNVQLEIAGKSNSAEVKILKRGGSGHHASAEISIETPRNSQNLSINEIKSNVPFINKVLSSDQPV